MRKLPSKRAKKCFSGTPLVSWYVTVTPSLIGAHRPVFLSLTSSGAQKHCEWVTVPSAHLGSRFVSSLVLCAHAPKDCPFIDPDLI